MQIDSNRVMSLIKRDWILYKRHCYVGVIALISVCAFIMFLFISEGDNVLPDDVAEIVFSVMLFSVGSIYTLCSFREFRRQADTISYLSIPASHFEKLLSRWIITLPLYLVICTLVFAISYLIFSLIAEQIWAVVFISFSDFRWPYFWDSIASYIFTHSIFLFSALCFNKNTLVKSMISFVVIWFLFVIFSYYINNGTVQADDSFKALLTSNYRYLMLLSVPIFWYLSYRRLRAKTA